MIFFLCDLLPQATFDAGHLQHISIAKEKWGKIPANLRKKIRTIEKKGNGDLTNVYDQARQYVDFAGEAKKKKWAATVASVKAQDIGGTPAGKWSAVKAAMAVRKYKDNGGKYKTKERGSLSNANWFQQQKKKGK